MTLGKNLDLSNVKLIERSEIPFFFATILKFLSQASKLLEYAGQFKLKKNNNKKNILEIFFSFSAYFLTL